MPRYSTVHPPQAQPMNILLFLVPISLVLLGLAIGAFIWAVRRGQFDNLQTPALDILADDDGAPPRSQQSRNDVPSAAPTANMSGSAQPRVRPSDSPRPQ
jgi:cbb3-type cytochrome oxidase maturation protein